MTGPVVAVATDVGAWRIVEPVVRELRRRKVTTLAMLAEPCAKIARQDGVEHVPLTAATVAEQAETVLAAGPSVLMLGTSVRPVVERALTLRARGRIPTVAVLDAMFLAELRFGTDFVELADVVTCADQPTADRLHRSGAPIGRLAVTGNPTLEEIGRWAQDDLPIPPWGRGDQGAPWWDGEVSPVDVLFVSSPVARMLVHGVGFEIDERQALADLLSALSRMQHLAPGGFRVRVRLHPVQRSEGLPDPPPGISIEPDDDPDRLASCALARVVVGLSSTLLGEARFLPRSAIAYLPGAYWDHEQVFAPEYGVQRARSADELQELLADAITRPPVPAPLAGHLGAAGRIADLLLKVASR